MEETSTTSILASNTTRLEDECFLFDKFCLASDIFKIQIFTNIKDAYRCQEKCQEIMDMNFWSWDPKSLDCYLMLDCADILGAVNNFRDWISGPKICKN